jgi:hypothetical protein
MIDLVFPEQGNWSVDSKQISLKTNRQQRIDRCCLLKMLPDEFVSPQHGSRKPFAGMIYFLSRAS